jgi:hypothetical protein
MCVLNLSVVFRRPSHETQISQVGSYDYAKQTLLHAKIPGFDYQFQDNLVLHTISSGFAGFVATSSCGLPLSLNPSERLTSHQQPYAPPLMFSSPA